MWTGVQWTGTIPGGCDAAVVHVGLADPLARRLVPDADDAAGRRSGARLGRRGRTGQSTQCTYWITVRNLTSNQVTFEGRFAVLS